MPKSPEDIETLTLYTRPFGWQAPGQIGKITAMPAKMVVEVDSNRTAGVRQERFAIGSDDLEYQDLTLPRAASKLLVDFFRRTMTFEFQQVWYECHSLPPYVWGIEEHILPSPRQKHSRYYADPVSPDNLIPGQPYALQSSRGAITHALLGLDEAADGVSINLSVLGGNGPLAITRTRELCKTLGSSIIRPIIYTRIREGAIQ